MKDRNNTNNPDQNQKDRQGEQKRSENSGRFEKGSERAREAGRKGGRS